MTAPFVFLNLLTFNPLSLGVLMRSFNLPPNCSITPTTKAFPIQKYLQCSGIPSVQLSSKPFNLLLRPVLTHDRCFPFHLLERYDTFCSVAFPSQVSIVLEGSSSLSGNGKRAFFVVVFMTVLVFARFPFRSLTISPRLPEILVPALSFSSPIHSLGMRYWLSTFFSKTLLRVPFPDSCPGKSWSDLSGEDSPIGHKTRILKVELELLGHSDQVGP